MAMREREREEGEGREGERDLGVDWYHPHVRWPLVKPLGTSDYDPHRHTWRCASLAFR